MNNIKFVKNDNDMTYNPDKYLGSYYQFCQFKNNNGLYESRKVVFNEAGKIIKVFEKQYKSHEIKQFMKCHSVNKYKILAIREIVHAELPSTHDMMCAMSSLINNEFKKSDNLQV